MFSSRVYLALICLAGKTCLNLRLDGEIVRTATGPNTQPGGSEELEARFWDVHNLRGKTVTIQIVDDATGGWGHVNVDQLVQSDTIPQLPDLQDRVREFTVSSKYLVIPIKNAAKSCQVTLEVDGKPVRRYGTELATDPEAVDWYAFFTIESYHAKTRELGGHWVMVVYDEHSVFKRNAAFYTSTNLKQWKEESHLPGYYECTELFELPVDGNMDDTRWVVFAADARYAIGNFDGQTFTPEHEGKHQVHYGQYYASQTFDNSPDGRKIQMGWVRLDFPGMPFNQAFSFPHELTLHETVDGIRMFAKPVTEIEKLHRTKHVAEPQILTAGSPVSLPVSGRLFDVRATFELGGAKQVGLDIGGNTIVYDAPGQKLNGADLKPVDGRVSLQVLVDQPIIEICGNDGAVFITAERNCKGDVNTIKAFADGDGAGLSAWKCTNSNRSGRNRVRSVALLGKAN